MPDGFLDVMIGIYYDAWISLNAANRLHAKSLAPGVSSSAHDDIKRPELHRTASSQARKASFVDDFAADEYTFMDDEKMYWAMKVCVFFLYSNN